MDSAWVTAGVSTLALITTAIYNTGGRGALERRVIGQELEVAALLPTGAERDQMERSAQDRAAVYPSRRVGQEPLKPRQHAVLLGLTAVSLVVGSAGGVMTQSVRADTAILTILDSRRRLRRRFRGGCSEQPLVRQGAVGPGRCSRWGRPTQRAQPATADGRGRDGGPPPAVSASRFQCCGEAALCLPRWARELRRAR